MSQQPFLDSNVTPVIPLIAKEFYSSKKGFCSRYSFQKIIMMLAATWA